MSARINHRREESKKNGKAHQQPTRGGLDVAEPPSNTRVDIKSVPQGEYQERREMTWSEVLMEAFGNRCEKYLVPEARDYYFGIAPGRVPFHCYLPIDIVVELSMAFERPLELHELKLLVAEDGEEGAVALTKICKQRLIVALRQELVEVNRKLVLDNKPSIGMADMRPSQELIDSCRFTPVRWVLLSPDKLMVQRFYNQASRCVDVLELLATTNTWNYIGNGFPMPDPADKTKVKTVDVSGAPWQFQPKLGKYQTFPHSPWVIMMKTSPTKVLARASVGPKFIDDKFKALVSMQLPEEREQRADAANDVWSGNYLDLFDAVDNAA
jgi:hypothetical protein